MGLMLEVNFPCFASYEQYVDVAAAAGVEAVGCSLL